MSTFLRVSSAAALLALSCFHGPRGLAASEETLSMEDERRAVDELIATVDNVELRKISPRIFRVAESLLKEKGDREARPYFEKGLQGNSWALPEQLTLGEILARNGQPEALREKAEMVLRVGEEDEVLRASLLLGRGLPEAPEVFAEIKTTGPVLVLAPVGAVSIFTLHDVRAALSRRLGIEVRIAALNLELPEADRSLKAIFDAEGGESGAHRWFFKMASWTANARARCMSKTQGECVTLPVSEPGSRGRSPFRRQARGNVGRGAN